MGAAQSAAINKADPEEVGLRLTAALTARWFSTSDQSQSASRAELTADQTLVGARNAILDVSSQTLQEFMAYSGTPARRELTDAIWEFDAFKAYATAAVRHDPKISKLSYRAVPKHCIESEFWRLYFVSVYAALAEVQAEDSLMPTSKSRRLSTMSSPKRLTPLSLPRGNSCFLRKEPWARVGGESLWLLSEDSQHLTAGKRHGGAAMTAEGPHPGVAALAFTNPTALFEIDEGLNATEGAPGSAEQPREPGGLCEEWTICCWFRADVGGATGARCLACADASEQLVCVREGELGVCSAETGFVSSGFNVGALTCPGWYHLAAVGQLGKTSFSLNGDVIGIVDVQCTARKRFIGNAPVTTFGVPPQPFGVVADVRGFTWALDEAVIVALARMVPEADRPTVPSTGALAAYARKRTVDHARKQLALAAEMIAAADAALGSSLAADVRQAYDLDAIREQLLHLSTAAGSGDSPGPQ